jgi:hypothetical protein
MSSGMFHVKRYGRIANFSLPEDRTVIKPLSTGFGADSAAETRIRT